MESLKKRKGLAAISALTAITILGAGYIYHRRRQCNQVEPEIRPEGHPKELSTRMLQFGSKLFQSKGPLQDTDTYLVAFHPMKHLPQHQMEAHHYCKQMNEDFAQCILYDSNTANANLIGIEYIISERLYDLLPLEERSFWHPHNYEILSGQLCAPGLPKIAEKELLRTKMNSYGKTFHTWRARCWEGEKPFLDTLPKGEAILGWSFNHDGEIKQEMILNRDKKMEIDTTEKREHRVGLSKEANPQVGVNSLKDKFPNSNPRTTPFGVMDSQDWEVK